MDYAKLKTEVTTDPEAIGYAGMTDAEAADALNARNRPHELPTISGSQILNAIAPAEWAPLSDAQKQWVRDVFNLGDAIDVRPGTNARTVLVDVFGAAPNTLANLTAAVQTTISRAQEIGLGGRVYARDVAKVRA